MFSLRGYSLYAITIANSLRNKARQKPNFEDFERAELTRKKTRLDDVIEYAGARRAPHGAHPLSPASTPALEKLSTDG